MISRGDQADVSAETNTLLDVPVRLLDRLHNRVPVQRSDASQVVDFSTDAFGCELKYILPLKGFMYSRNE